MFVHPTLLLWCAEPDPKYIRCSFFDTRSELRFFFFRHGSKGRFVGSRHSNSMAFPKNLCKFTCHSRRTPVEKVPISIPSASAKSFQEVRPADSFSDLATVPPPEPN